MIGLIIKNYQYNLFKVTELSNMNYLSKLNQMYAY